jgi:hypothetical protein
LLPGVSSDSKEPPFDLRVQPYFMAPFFNDTDGLTELRSLTLWLTARTGSLAWLSYEISTAVSTLSSALFQSLFM